MSATAWPTLRPVHLLALLLSVGAYGVLAYATPRAEFGQLLVLFGLAFGAYALLLKTSLPLRHGLAAALVLRLLWLPALPALSDDYYRFRWDGLLVAHGFNPFQHRPDELVIPNHNYLTIINYHDSISTTSSYQNSPQHLPPSLSRKLRQLYPKLNSPHYYSVYPPVSQAAFGLAAWAFPDSERGFVWVLRLLILGAETGSALLLLALLRRSRQPETRALWYLLNPLVIVELSGNLHFEALVVCLVLLAFWLLLKGRWKTSAGALGAAVATKMLPLLVLPLLVRRLGWFRFVGYAALVGATSAALFLPFANRELLLHLSSSLDLYFRKFEFNASLYYLLRAAGRAITGYNQIALIGPGLALATVVAVLGLALGEKRPGWLTLPRTLLLALTCYYLLATVVHPWYLVPLVALGALAGMRYPLVWSGAAVISYSAYQTSTYTENLWLVALEYSILLLAILWELRLKPLPQFKQEEGNTPA